MHIENLLFILLIAIAVLFRLLASKVGEAKKRQQSPDRGSTTSPSAAEPIEHAPVESDEERIRRFLEALGQPAGSRPPPPVAPRTDVPPRPLAPVQPPPVLTPRRVPTYRKRQIAEAPKPPPPVFEPGEASPLRVGSPPLIEPSAIIETPAEAYAAPKAFGVARREEARTDMITLLASTSGLRNAIIIREIFGPPRSLQAFDLL